VQVDRRLVAGAHQGDTLLDVGLGQRQREGAAVAGVAHQVAEMRSAVGELRRDAPQLARGAIDETRAQALVEQDHAVVDMVERGLEDVQLLARRFDAGARAALLVEQAGGAHAKAGGRQRQAQRDRHQDSEHQGAVGRKDDKVRLNEHHRHGGQEADGGADIARDEAADPGRIDDGQQDERTRRRNRDAEPVEQPQAARRRDRCHRADGETPDRGAHRRSFHPGVDYTIRCIEIANERTGHAFRSAICDGYLTLG
jgi:hypothetical protein